MCMYVGFRVVCMADCRCVCLCVDSNRARGSELKVVNVFDFKHNKSPWRIST